MQSQLISIFSVFLMVFSIEARGATEFINGAKFVRCNKINQCIELSSDQMQRTSIFPILAFGLSNLKIYEVKDGLKSSTLIHTWKAREGYIDLMLNRIVLRQLSDSQNKLELIYFIDSGKTILI
ncbi:MAG: hypothetical protein IPJ71_04800 [Bdellovibrionales bacterium]|nr:hypothetical protein [Bdellovibrionales bacterium]